MVVSPSSSGGSSRLSWRSMGRTEFLIDMLLSKASWAENLGNTEKLDTTAEVDDDEEIEGRGATEEVDEPIDRLSNDGRLTCAELDAEGEPWADSLEDVRVILSTILPRKSSLA